MITRTVRALVALLIMGLLLIAPPVLLVTYIGNPWPAEGVSLTAPLTDGAIVGALAIVVWTLWAQMAWCLVAETIAMLTRDRVSPPLAFTFRVQQHLARRLVSAVALATIAAPLLSSFAPTHADAVPLVATTTTATPARAPASTSAAAPEGDQQPGRPPPHGGSTTSTVTVMRLDSLWSISERTLGDGERWNEIAALNEGRIMEDGSTFTSADQIRPGWQLAVPAETPQPETPQANQRLVVEPGDTLSQIAADHLGDGTRYEDIFRASTTIQQPDGRHLIDPDIIDVGWTLAIPADDTSVALPDRDPPRDPSTKAPTTEPAEPDPPTSPSPPVLSGGIVPSPPADAGTQFPGTEDLVATPSDHEADETDGTAAPWMLAGLAGAGALLGGGLHLAVRSRRRRQLRGRQPGRIIGPVDADLIEVEKSVWISEPAAATLGDLDLLLRELAADRAQRGLEMPAVAAIELLEGHVTLHLTSTANMALPWLRADGEALRWRTAVGPGRATAEQANLLSRVDPPYPLLVTLGTSDDGATWLVNLEELGHLALRGDPDRCLDLTRYLLGELSLSPWSSQARIVCVGLGDAKPFSDRAAIYPADGAEHAAAEVLERARQTVERAQKAGGSPPTGRTGQLDDDLWPAYCLLLVNTAPTSADDALRDLLQLYPGQSGSSVVAVGAPTDLYGVRADLGPDGMLQLPQFDLRLKAASLSTSEAEGCAALLRAFEESIDSPLAHDVEATGGWEELADLGGAPRAEWTTSREEALAQEVSSRSVLPEPDVLYVDQAAITAEDVNNLAPVAIEDLAAEAAQVDPTLDQDVADWFDETCRRPRLTLLGPVAVKAYGVALTKRRPYFTEMLTFLALRRRHGVTAADLANAFSIEIRKVRIYVNTLRDWLGSDPATGVLHLPHADKSSSARTRGVPSYQLSDQLLIDTELFRRLRLRGQSHGGEGMTDLSRALDLVSGRPFDQLRPGGWSWLLDGERIDHYASAAAADVALLVATDALARGDLIAARRAAQIGIAAAPDEDSAELTMARVLSAEGNAGEATKRLAAIRNRVVDDEPPGDLPGRIDGIARRLEQSG